MIILVDAYNVLKREGDPSHVDERSRGELVRVLVRYARKRGHKFIVVFDGGFFIWCTQERSDGVDVVHAGRGRSADDYIKNYIAAHYKADLLLVSSDRELGRWACSYGVPSIDGALFFSLVRESLRTRAVHKKSATVVKTSHTSSPELDAIMEQAVKNAVVCKDENEEGAYLPKQRHRLYTHQLSKIEKLLRSKLEKL